MASLTMSGTLAEGGYLTCKIDVAPPPGCTVRASTTADGLTLVQVGGDGSAMFRVDDEDDVEGEITIEIVCDGHVEISATAPVPTLPPPVQPPPRPVQVQESYSANWPWKKRLMGKCPDGVRDSRGNWCPHVGIVVRIPLVLFTLLVCEFRCGDETVKLTFVAVGPFQLYP